MSHIGDDGTASGAFFNEGNTCFYLRKHGACSELIVCNVFLRIFCGDGIQIRFLIGVVVKAYLLNTCKDHQSICVQFLCKKSCCTVLLDDSTGTVQLGTLFKNRDSATACCDNDLLCLGKNLHGLDLYDLLWLRCCKDSSVLSFPYFCDEVSFFFLGFCFFCIQDTTDDLLRFGKCFIIWINDNLCENGADRFIDSSGNKFRTNGVLKVIADITLAHGRTYGHWCKCIIRMCLAEFIHCGVDHPYLRTVAVGDYHAGSLFNQVCDCLGCKSGGCFLLRKCGTKCSVA